MFGRSGLPSFEYLRANSREQATALLQDPEGSVRAVMGGTDLFPGMRDGMIRPSTVVDVKYIAGMRDIRYDAGEGLVVGAAATMNQVASHPDILAHYPLLAQSAGTVASHQIRNRATLGGNLCNASPCADTSPAVIALEADLLLCGAGGDRTVPAEKFFLGPGQTALEPGELLVGIRFSPALARSAARYLKLGRSRAGDLALVGVAVLGLSGNTPSGYRFRIALGSVAPVPIRANQAEQFLAENALSQETLEGAAKLAMGVANPISDVRGGAAYQRAMVRTLALRGLRDVHAQLTEVR